jgi:hypothetical protein
MKNQDKQHIEASGSYIWLTPTTDSVENATFDAGDD